MSDNERDLEDVSPERVLEVLMHERDNYHAQRDRARALAVALEAELDVKQVELERWRRRAMAAETRLDSNDWNPLRPSTPRRPRTAGEDPDDYQLREET